MNKQFNSGFTLIELMIVVAIIGILASIAVPAYQDYTVRSKITEGLIMAGPAKTSVLDGYMSNDVPGIATSSAGFADGFTATKYVSDITIDPDNGMITITYDANTITQISTGVDDTITLTPSLGGLEITPGMDNGGNVDWACASATNTTATGRLLPVAVPGSIPSRFAPTECK